ncbi:hypothetical protein [Micromonospora endolithica]|uniref:hypothetical protein n=1 Tax=Micromonospora endolithica TaxID=230091 RepID=UPI001315AE20|nr:hypothetical protein [Micromonospora endolithica]
MPVVDAGQCEVQVRRQVVGETSHRRTALVSGVEAARTAAASGPAVLRHRLVVTGVEAGVPAAADPTVTSNQLIAVVAGTEAQVAATATGPRVTSHQLVVPGTGAEAKFDSRHVSLISLGPDVVE